MPLLATPDVDGYGDPAGPVVDEFTDQLVVTYSYGAPWGERLVNWSDLELLGLPRRMLRRQAATNLGGMLDQVRIHGQAAMMMLSFDGLESSLLLADPFWERLARRVPGRLVVGVPSRDVVVVTGSESRAGLARVRGAVDRVLFAGDEHLLCPDLLVRRNDGRWEPFAA